MDGGDRDSGAGHIARNAFLAQLMTEISSNPLLNNNTQAVYNVMHGELLDVFPGRIDLPDKLPMQIIASLADAGASSWPEPLTTPFLPSSVSHRR